MEGDDVVGYPATFVQSQKGTQLLQDENNHVYRIHHLLAAQTHASYRCVKRASAKCPALATLLLEPPRIVKTTDDHTHGPNLLAIAAREEENRMIKAAALVGKVSQNQVMSKIKTNIQRSALPEAMTEMRKSHALGQALQRERNKVAGIAGAVPKTPGQIMELLPDRYKLTAAGGPFLRCMEHNPVDDTLIMLFMSDHGRWVLARSQLVFGDGTFGTCPAPFCQIYFLLGQMPGKRAVPCGFALLPNKTTATYRKMWEKLGQLVVFEPGCPTRIILDFERAAMNVAGAACPGAKICGCNFHFNKV